MRELIVEPDILLVRQASFRVAQQVKSAILDFFLRAGGASGDSGAASATSPTSSSSPATPQPPTSIV